MGGTAVLHIEMGSLKTLSVKGKRKKIDSGCEKLSSEKIAENFCTFCFSISVPFLLHTFRHYSFKTSMHENICAFSTITILILDSGVLLHWHLTSTHHKCLCILLLSTIEYEITLTKVSGCKTGLKYIIQKETLHTRNIFSIQFNPKSTWDTSISRENTLTVKVSAV